MTLVDKIAAEVVECLRHGPCDPDDLQNALVRGGATVLASFHRGKHYRVCHFDCDGQSVRCAYDMAEDIVMFDADVDSDTEETYSHDFRMDWTVIETAQSRGGIVFDVTSRQAFVPSCPANDFVQSLGNATRAAFAVTRAAV